MQTQESRPTIWCMLLVALSSNPGAHAAVTDAAKTVQPKPATVLAATQASARHQGAFKANGVNWTCKGTQCSAAAVPAAATALLATCQALALEVGAMKSFRVANHGLTADELQQCNSGAATADAGRVSVQEPQAAKKPATVPGTASSPASHTKRLVTADDFATRAQPLPDAPHRATAMPRADAKDPAAKGQAQAVVQRDGVATPQPSPTGKAAPVLTNPAHPPIPPFVPVLIRTALLTLAGTGVAEGGYRFTPVAVRTPQLTLTGAGIAEIPLRFPPVAVRTPALTLMGTGRSD